MTHAPVCPSAVTAALRSAGVTRGTVALIHPDAIVAAQFAVPSNAASSVLSNERRLDLLIEAMQSAVGPDGTLLIPTFSYSFPKGEPFDVRNTPSAVGMVSERLRKLPGVRRTLDPIFSFACWGRLAEELCALPVKECFGSDSVFAVLHRVNALLVDLGCSMSRGGTFVHYVETAHGVDYRYNKTFNGTIISADGNARPLSVIYNVRDLSRRSEADLARLQNRLADEGKSKTVTVGRFRIMAVTAKDVFDTAWRMLDEDPISLIAEGARQ